MEPTLGSRRSNPGHGHGLKKKITSGGGIKMSIISLFKNLFKILDAL